MHPVESDPSLYAGRAFGLRESGSGSDVPEWLWAGDSAGKVTGLVLSNLYDLESWADAGGYLASAWIDCSIRETASV